MLLELPVDLEDQLRTEVHEYEESWGMSYIPTYERAAYAAGLEQGTQIGQLRGLREGLAFALILKFGAAGSAFARELTSVVDVNRLDSLLQAVETANSVDDLRVRLKDPAQ